MAESIIGISIFSKITQDKEIVLITLIVFIVRENSKGTVKEKKLEKWPGPEKGFKGVKLGGLCKFL